MKHRIPSLLFLPLFLSFLSFSFRLAALDVDEIRRSVCVLKGDNDRGAGFFAKIDGRLVVVTANHVILELKNARIYDANGEEVPYNEILTSPYGDVAVVPVLRLAADEIYPALEISWNDPLWTGMKILAPGLPDPADGEPPSQGKAVASSHPYRSTDLQFGPYSSGGPILEERSGRVVGIAAFVQEISPSVLDGTYHARNQRMAMPLYGVKPSLFQRTDRKGVAKDQAEYMPLREAYLDICEILKNPNGDGHAERLKRLDAFYGKRPSMSSRREWNTSWLERQHRDLLQLVDEARSIVMSKRKPFDSKKAQPLESETEEPSAPSAPPPRSSPPESVNREELARLWNDSIGSIAFKTRPPVFLSCPLCDGRGRVKFRRGRSSRSGEPKTSDKPCPLCEGKKKIVLAAPVRCAILPKEFAAKAKDLFMPESAPILGHSLGAFSDSPEKLVPRHLRKRCETTNFAAFEIVSFRGNPLVPEAEETRLWFFGGVLLRIELLFPSGAGDPVETARRLLPNPDSPDARRFRTVRMRRLSSMKKPDWDAVQRSTNWFETEESHFRRIVNAMKKTKREYEAFSRDPFHRLAPAEIGADSDCFFVIFQHAGFDCCAELELP